MTAAQEQLYVSTLRALLAAGVEFCLIGSFAVRRWQPALPLGLVGDCDLQVPPDPAALTVLVRQLRALGWRVTLWETPVCLPLTAHQLTGKYYLRARQAGAVLDCSFEHDNWSWADFNHCRCWHQGLPLLPLPELLQCKAACHRPTDERLLAWWHAQATPAA